MGATAFQGLGKRSEAQTVQPCSTTADETCLSLLLSEATQVSTRKLLLTCTPAVIIWGDAEATTLCFFFSLSLIFILIFFLFLFLLWRLLRWLLSKQVQQVIRDNMVSRPDRQMPRHIRISETLDWIIKKEPTHHTRAPHTMHIALGTSLPGYVDQ